MSNDSYRMTYAVIDEHGSILVGVFTSYEDAHEAASRFLDYLDTVFVAKIVPVGVYKTPLIPGVSRE